ncbi:MAG: IPExxxVDY family protein [Flavobacteriales bacterium]
MKHRLETPELSETTLLYGISCHEKPHRLCWAINRELGLRMGRKEEDLEFLIAGSNGGEEKAHYTLFSYIAEEDHVTHSLIENRSEKGPLIPQHPEVDHFFLIEAEEEREDLDRMEELRAVGPILAVFPIDPATLPSVADLLV